MHRCFYSFYFSDLLLQQYFFIHSSSNIELLLNALYLNSDAPKCYSQATFTHSHPQATEGVNPKAFFMSPKYWRYRMSSSGNEFTTIFKHGYVFPLTRNFRLQNTTEKKKNQFFTTDFSTIHHAFNLGTRPWQVTWFLQLRKKEGL